MIIHIALFRWKENISQAEINKIMDDRILKMKLRILLT